MKQNYITRTVCLALLLMLSGAFNLNAQCTGGNFPGTNNSVSSGAWSPHYIHGSLFTGIPSGSLIAIGYKGLNTGALRKLYIYSDVSGNPGTLVAYTGAFTVGLGQVAVPVLTPTLIPAGNYWIMTNEDVGSDMGITNASVSTSSYRYISHAFNSAPPASASWSGYSYPQEDFYVAFAGTSTVTVTGNSLVCLGSSSTLTASGGTSYSWNNSATGSVIVVSPTVNTLYRAYDISGCSGELTVTVQALPTLTITGNNTVCAGKAATLTASGASTFTWNGTVSGASIALAPSSNTVYTVTGTGTNACSNTAAIAVTVNALPVINLTVTNAVICRGSAVILTASGANTFSLFASTGSNPVSGVAFSPTATATYSAYGTNTLTGCSSTAAALQAITVNTLPAISAAASVSNVCIGLSTTLTASGANTYTWVSSTGASISNGVAFSPTTSGTYSVSGTNTLTGCVSSTPAIVSIAVNPRPVVFASASQSVLCAGNVSTLSASGAHTYTWTSGSGQSVSNGTGFTPSITTTYTVAGTNTVTGCTNTNIAVQSITVNPVPVLTASASSTVICAGNSTSLTASGAVTYTWSDGSITNGAAFTPTATGSYTVLGSNPLTGCTSTVSPIVSVTVNPRPVVSAAATATQVCEGFSVTLTGAGADTYVWNNGIVDGVAFAPASTATYAVVGTNTLTGCTSTNNAFQTVIVNPLPVVSASITAPVICNGFTTMITGSGADSYTITGGVAESTPFTPSVTGTYSLSGTYSLTGCTSKSAAVVSVTVNPLPVLNASVSDAVICQGFTTMLNVSGADIYSVSATSGTLVPGMPFTPSATSIYSVLGTNTLTGCSSTVHAIAGVTVNALPVVTGTAVSATICEGETATLSASGAVSYSWNAVAGSSVHIITPLSTSDYTITGIDVNGCQDTTIVTQIVDACTSLKAHTRAQFSVYPNPSTGMFTIAGISGSAVIILDELGRVVRNVIIDNNGEVFVSGLSAGVYTLVSNTAEHRAYARLIVTH